jgi:hypothetical protein
MVGYVLSQFPYLDTKGVSGYSFTSANYTISDGNNGTINLAGIGGLFTVLDTQDISDMQAIWEPIISHVKATWPTAVTTLDMNPYPSFQSWFSVFYDQNEAGNDEYVGSRLLDAKSLTNSTTVGETFKISLGSAYLVAGKGVRDAKPRGGSTSVTPTWRRTIAHVGKLSTGLSLLQCDLFVTLYLVTGTGFAPLNATARTEALATVDALTEPLRQLAPDMGAYVNEV